MAAAGLAARGRGAVLGCLVADAAATPSHWVYDASKLAEHLKTATKGPAFCTPPANQFYTTAPGAQSCYGDQTVVLLESLVANGGRLVIEDYSARLEQKFGKASIYEIDAVDPAPDKWPAFKENPKDAEGKVIEEQRVWSMPVPGPWRHGSIKGFLKNYVAGKRFPECGSDDEQIDGACKVAPLVALLAGSEELLPSVDKAVRVTQNTDTAVAYACGFARVLEKLVLGTASSVDEAISLARAELLDSKRAFQNPLDEKVADSLEHVGRFTGETAADVGKALKPAESGFPFAGLS